MEYNDKLFDKIATTRIKRFYDMNKDAFTARAMDLKDLLQEMRIALWQRMQKYESLAEEEYAKLINKILSTKLIDAKQRGYRHMKTEDVTIEENNEEIIIKGHTPQFLDIESINESALQDNSTVSKNRAKMMVEAIKNKLNHFEQVLLDTILEGKTEDEMACEQICCPERDECSILTTPEKHLSTHGNIGKREYQGFCKEFDKLNKQSIQINRFKKSLLKKVKIIAKNL